MDSFGTELTRDDRAKLYPRLGLLYPEGIESLKQADNYEHVRAAVEPVQVNSFVFEISGFICVTNYKVAKPTLLLFDFHLCIILLLLFGVTV